MAETNPFKNQKGGWNYFSQNPYTAIAAAIPNDSYLGLYADDVVGRDSNITGSTGEVSSLDPGTARVRDAAYKGLTDAAQSGAIKSGVYSLGSTLAGRFSPDMALNAAMSGFSPMALGTGFAREGLAAAFGLDTNTGASKTANVLAGVLGSMVNPAVGVIGSVLSPIAAEGFGKLTGTRKDEGLKSTLEAAYGGGFLDASRKRADIKAIAASPYAQASWSTPTVNSITGEAEPGYGINNNADITAARNVENAYAAQNEQRAGLADATKIGINITPSYNPMAGYFDSSLVGMGIDPNARTRTDPADLVSTVSAMRQRDMEVNPTMWSGNINSIRNPKTLEAAAARYGVDMSGWSDKAKSEAALAFNSYFSGPSNLGDIGAHVDSLSRENAIAKAQEAAAAQTARDTAAAGGGWGYGVDGTFGWQGGGLSTGGSSINGGLGSGFGGLGGLSGFGGGTGSMGGDD